MVLDENELPFPAGWRASNARRRQAQEIRMHLTSDQHVRLRRAQVTDKARERTRRPIDTQAMYVHHIWQPGRRRVGAIAQQCRLNPAGLDQAKSESTGRVAMSTPARTVD